MHGGAASGTDKRLREAEEAKLRARERAKRRVQDTKFPEKAKARQSADAVRDAARRMLQEPQTPAEAPMRLDADPTGPLEEAAEIGRIEREEAETERQPRDATSKKKASAQRARQRLQSDGRKSAKKPSKGGMFGFLRRG